jgi:hypothetical protein
VYSGQCYLGGGGLSYTREVQVIYRAEVFRFVSGENLTVMD